MQSTARHGASATATPGVPLIAPASSTPTTAAHTTPHAAPHAFPFFPAHTSDFIFAPPPVTTPSQYSGAGGTLHEWHMPPPFAIDPALLDDRAGTLSIVNTTSAVSADSASSPITSNSLAAPPPAGGTFQFVEYSYNSEGGQGGKRGKRGPRGGQA
ncbi:uncharacterized protein TRAVEDRAFT_54853 [Trametes versicolor FP-101664 SS1]|uniref:Uncharacterized protein n=1 Tax=Trametes versicolor (strain FP-101664) TaxID=717944 RepID=R7S866_TRAVS|nr:uncharacterized protein TRAVEDRAFT_54853 [Trametes versicolor FP-101664 SS1]EIW51144.1 hypothetical protein TRAVEDRAFT_54853 [Trametes versicolor FP-101664 SS1]